jgi:hypothetical protein
MLLPPPGSQLLLLLLGLEGSVELGSLDQVMDVSTYRGFNRCPALVCSKSKEGGKNNICFELCSNPPSKFYSMGGSTCSAECISSP